ncbi:MAG: electron transfer flavoprotein subunit alpha/FixB family protein [Anaerotignum sp.]|nr:electron transfer flavoprotein subunit alpha/FixB family protein [Anaerotignum sp.]
MMKKAYLSEIWVYCETREKELTEGTKELLGKAKTLVQESGCIVAAVLFAGAEKAAAAFGADKIYRFHSCGEETQAKAILQQMEKGRPWAFLFPATSKGRMVAAMLSVHLKTGLTADCIELSVEDGFLKQTRPAFGGSLMADILCRHSYPQMATVQRGVFPISEADFGKKAEIVKCPFAEKEISAVKVLKRNLKNKDEVFLNDAKIVLAGGMGLETKENFALLKQTAEKIGAVPAASRAAVNAGLVPYAWQVGQSGKTIRPEIYIACGISGAVQHLAGIQGAGCIIAVNTDRKAPIFDHADIGIVEDCVTFLQDLQEKEE